MLGFAHCTAFSVFVRASLSNKARQAKSHPPATKLTFMLATAFPTTGQACDSMFATAIPTSPELPGQLPACESLLWLAVDIWLPLALLLRLTLPDRECCAVGKAKALPAVIYEISVTMLLIIVEICSRNVAPTGKCT